MVSIHEGCVKNSYHAMINKRTHLLGMLRLKRID